MKRMTACKKLFLLSIALFVLLSFQIINSVGASSIMWNQTYGSAKREVAHWVIETSDMGFAIGGYIRNINAPEEASDFLLVKTDANGNMEWNQTFGGIEDDEAFSGFDSMSLW